MCGVCHSVCVCVCGVCPMYMCQCVCVCVHARMYAGEQLLFI